MDREALLRCRRELYRQRRERETPEEKEVRLSGRREYYRQLAYPESRAHTFYPSCMHTFSGSPLDAVSICLVEKDINNGHIIGRPLI